jgi:hypothetical protein
MGNDDTRRLAIHVVGTTCARGHGGMTIESMRFFYDRMGEHGIIVCDDYGSTLCPGATRAVHEFFEDKPERMLALPSFGGFIIKGVRTSTTGGIATA